MGTFKSYWGKRCHNAKQPADYVVANLLAQNDRVTQADLSHSLLLDIHPEGMGCFFQIFLFPGMAGFRFFDIVSNSVDRLNQNKVKVYRNYNWT